MANEGKFIIYINETHYWDLSLIPTKNEFDEDINRCALVDSVTQQEIAAINFDSTWLVPIFQTRSQIGMKQLAARLKEVTDKNNIQITPRDKMPQDKRIKETKKAVKRIIK